MEPAAYGPEGVPAGPSWLEQTADRLARRGWQTLLVVVALALVGGVITAIWEPPSGDVSAPAADVCESPPCFSIGTPRPSDLLVIVPTLGYVVVVVLGIPSLLVGARDVLLGHRSVAGKRLLVFFGPLVVFLGMELVPHVVSPCLVASPDSDALSGLCEPLAHAPGDVDIAGRWHGLHHAAIGALPMTALYWRALRRWRPAVVGTRAMGD